MSLTGHVAEGLADAWCEEFGYGLGPPTGVLVLRYPPTGTAPRFPEARDDHRHQLFWSPDGVLAVRRGGSTVHLAPDRAFWARRGCVVEVTGCERQTVHVVCVRQAPVHLSDVAAAVMPVSEDATSAVRALCSPGLGDDEALDLRDALFAGLGTPAPVAHAVRGTGLARRVASAMLGDPGDRTELAEWATRLHTSTKTLQRDFLREYGVPWSTWRTSMRLQAASALLARHSVGEVAHRVGYSSASAFVCAYRREYGVTPGRRRRQ